MDDATFAKVEPIHVAKMLAKIAKDEDVNLVMLGKQVPFVLPPRPSVLTRTSAFLS